MKLPLWTLSIPVIALCSLFQITYDLGEQGHLDSSFLRETIYPWARSFNGAATNIKFRLRGPQAAKQKIIILAADDNSVNHLGRWPWHRDLYARLIYSAFKMGAKYVGMDVVFSEPEERIPPEVYQQLNQTNPKLAKELGSFEGDPLFAEVISKYKDRLALGFTPQATCQPRYDGPANCFFDKTDLSQDISTSLGKFALPDPIPLPASSIQKTPLLHIITSLANISSYRDAALHAGSFLITPDPDGYIRRYPLFMVHQNSVYPSLAFELARMAKEDTAKIVFTDDVRVQKIYFSKSPEQTIPTTRLGYLDLNFRGPSESFPYISAWTLLHDSETGDVSLKEIFKDSIVLFGVTAVGLYDMRAFPFDSNTAGVEGHATALDNLLSNDALRSATSIHLDWLPLTLLISLGLLFAYLFSQLEAIPSLAIFISFCGIMGFIDKILFARNINFPSAFLFAETLLIFALILAARYIIEEKNKKFIKLAFSRYLAPQVVDLILKDPSKLAVGGERRELTILFSDLRNFTTLSEGMDPKTLSQFLNEYLTEMTEIVFKYEGTLDKYIGDAVMAFWGAPLHQDDHALKASLAALEMQKRLIEIMPHFKSKYGVDLAVGIGVNSGVVSVGNMGSERIFEYTVIGDHVNLASRLEGLTKLYGVKIICTQFTLAALPDYARGTVHSRVIDLVKVKGKSQSTALVELLPNPIPAEILKPFEAAQVHFRAREWDQARALFEQSNRLYESTYGHEDSVCKIFKARCELFKEKPPAENWDGSIEMRSK